MERKNVKFNNKNDRFDRVYHYITEDKIMMLKQIIVILAMDF